MALPVLKDSQPGVPSRSPVSRFLSTLKQKIRGAQQQVLDAQTMVRKQLTSTALKPRMDTVGAVVAAGGSGTPSEVREAFRQRIVGRVLVEELPDGSNRFVQDTNLDNLIRLAGEGRLFYKDFSRQPGAYGMTQQEWIAGQESYARERAISEALESGDLLTDEGYVARLENLVDSQGRPVGSAKQALELMERNELFVQFAPGEERYRKQDGQVIVEMAPQVTKTLPIRQTGGVIVQPEPRVAMTLDLERGIVRQTDPRTGVVTERQANPSDVREFGRELFQTARVRGVEAVAGSLVALRALAGKAGVSDSEFVSSLSVEDQRLLAQAQEAVAGREKEAVGYSRVVEGAFAAPAREMFFGEPSIPLIASAESFTARTKALGDVLAFDPGFVMKSELSSMIASRESELEKVESVLYGFKSPKEAGLLISPESAKLLGMRSELITEIKGLEQKKRIVGLAEKLREAKVDPRETEMLLSTRFAPEIMGEPILVAGGQYPDPGFRPSKGLFEIVPKKKKVAEIERKIEAIQLGVGEGIDVDKLGASVVFGGVTGGIFAGPAGALAGVAGGAIYSLGSDFTEDFLYAQKVEPGVAFAVGQAVGITGAMGAEVGALRGLARAGVSTTSPVYSALAKRTPTVARTKRIGAVIELDDLASGTVYAGGYEVKTSFLGDTKKAKLGRALFSGRTEVEELVGSLKYLDDVPVEKPFAKVLFVLDDTVKLRSTTWPFSEFEIPKGSAKALGLDFDSLQFTSPLSKFEGTARVRGKGVVGKILGPRDIYFKQAIVPSPVLKSGMSRGMDVGKELFVGYVPREPAKGLFLTERGALRYTGVVDDGFLTGRAGAYAADILPSPPMRAPAALSRVKGTSVIDDFVGKVSKFDEAPKYASVEQTSILLKKPTAVFGKPVAKITPKTPLSKSFGAAESLKVSPTAAGTITVTKQGRQVVSGFAEAITKTKAVPAVSAKAFSSIPAVSARLASMIPATPKVIGISGVISAGARLLNGLKPSKQFVRESVLLERKAVAPSAVKAKPVSLTVSKPAEFQAVALKETTALKDVIGTKAFGKSQVIGKTTALTKPVEIVKVAPATKDILKAKPSVSLGAVALAKPARLEMISGAQKVRLDTEVSITPSPPPPAPPILGLKRTEFAPSFLGIGVKPQGFHTELKVGGKFRRQTKQPLMRDTAAAFGAFLADESAARTYRVVPAKKAPIKKSPREFGSRQFKFYPKKNARDTFVERSSFAIDSPGEKRQITRKGLAALKRNYWARKAGELSSPKSKRLMFTEKPMSAKGFGLGGII